MGNLTSALQALRAERKQAQARVQNLDYRSVGLLLRSGAQGCAN
jgi:hypothetical protein